MQVLSFMKKKIGLVKEDLKSTFQAMQVEIKQSPAENYIK